VGRTKFVPVRVVDAVNELLETVALSVGQETRTGALLGGHTFGSCGEGVREGWMEVLVREWWGEGMVWQIVATAAAQVTCCRCRWRVLWWALHAFVSELHAPLDCGCGNRREVDAEGCQQDNGGMACWRGWLLLLRLVGVEGPLLFDRSHLMSTSK